MIVIVDYSMGNTGSIKNMIKKIGYNAIISSNVGEILEAKKLILPGVGSFDHGMKNLIDLGFVDILNQKVKIEKTPILGICVGFQLFSKKSEEGNFDGLRWIDAETIKFKFSESNLKIPHMGWNSVILKRDSSLFTNFSSERQFYFVHSYHVVCKNSDEIVTTTNYGYEFVSTFQKDNIYGTQFHPEKSHKFGMQLIRNFIERC